MSLYREFKRRKVFRVAVVYAATAFAVVEAADLMLPRMGVPDWATNLVIALAVLGLPIALVLAWALELTPDGVRVTRAATDDPGDEPAPALLGGRTIVAAALLLAVGVGLGAGLFLAPRGAPGDAVATEVGANGALDRSIAVLPFADFSPDGDQRWFSDGLAEEILNALARLPDLRVASRTGSFQFRDRSGDVVAIADSLGVAHILEGSVRRAGDRVRITAQLIRAADGAHLWSQSFDRDGADVIRVQEEIAYEIARTLQTALDPEELARMVAAGTNSIAAHEAFPALPAPGEQGERAGRLEPVDPGDRGPGGGALTRPAILPRAPGGRGVLAASARPDEPGRRGHRPALRSTGDPRARGAAGRGSRRARPGESAAHRAGAGAVGAPPARRDGAGSADRRAGAERRGVEGARDPRDGDRELRPGP